MSALGKLVASIVLDTAEFTQGTDKASFAAAKTAGSIDKAFKDVESSVKGTLGGIAGAFAAGFGIAALKSTFDSFVEGTAKLADLSKQTGIAVEWLSGIGPVAKAARVPLEDIAQAADKMSKSLISGTNETKGAAKAFEFLGINTKDASGKLKDSGTLIDEVALALNEMEDSNVKTVVAMDLFGKTGAKLLPFLGDLAEYGERNAKVTAQQAQLAEDYEKDLIRLGSAQSAVGKIISSEVLPVADAFVKQLLEMTTRTGGMRDQAKALAADGSIRDFAIAGVRSFALVLDAGDSVVRVFQAVGQAVGLAVTLNVQAFSLIVASATDAGMALKGVGEVAAGAALAMSGNWVAGNELIKQGWSDLKTAGKDFSSQVKSTFDASAEATQAFKEKFDKTMSAPLAGAVFFGGFEEQLGKVDKGLHASGKSAKDAADDYGALGKEVKSTKDAYDALYESLTEGVAKLQMEVDYMRQWGMVTKETTVAQTQAKLAYQESNGVLAKHAETLGVSVAVLKESALALAARKDALTTSVATETQYIAEVKRMNDAMASSVQNVVDRIQKEQDAIATYGMSASAITEYTIKQLEAKKAIAEVTEGGEKNAAALQLQIDKMAQLGGLQTTFEGLKQQTKLWDDISSKAGNFFSDLVFNGKSAFDSLKQSLKSFAAEILAFFAKKYVLQMIAGVGGSVGAGAANAANGMGNSLIGTGLNAAGSWLGSTALGVGFAQGAGTGAGIWAGAGYGEAALTGAAGIGESVGSMYAAGSDALAALGPAGWIALAALAAYAIFAQKKGGPKTSGTGISDIDSEGNVSTGQITDIRRFYNADDKSLDNMVQKVVTATATSFTELLKKFGGTSGTVTFTQSIDSDPQGTAMNRIATQAFIDGLKVFQQKNENLARDGSQNSAEMQLQAERALIAALQASHLQTDMAALFSGVVAATISQSDYEALIAKALDLQVVLDTVASNTLPGFSVAVAKAMQGTGETLGATTNRVAAQWASLNSVFKTGDDKITEAQRAIKAAFDSIGVGVPASADAFKKLVKTIDLSSSSGRELFDVLSLVAPSFQMVSDAAGAALNDLNSAIGSRNSEYARQLTLESRNDVASQFATAIGRTFGEDLLAQMALNPEAFLGVGAEAQKLLAKFLGLQTTLENYDKQLNKTVATSGTGTDYSSYVPVGPYVPNRVAPGGNAVTDTAYVPPDTVSVTDYINPAEPVISVPSGAADPQIAAVQAVQAQIARLEKFITSSADSNKRLYDLMLQLTVNGLALKTRES